MLQAKQETRIPEKRQVPVSLVVTVYNEGKDVHVLLQGLLSQTVKPVEIIIVDGGSTDDTVEKISSFIRSGHPWITLIIDPTCSSKFSNSPIAKGRNVGIKVTTQETIAVTDAGTELAHDWLEKLTEPLIDNTADYVGGFYKIESGKSIWGKYFSLLNTPIIDDVQTFIPSSRSFAFRKALWSMVGGYPLGYKYGEDTEFVLRLQSVGARRSIRPEAMVIWHPANTEKWGGGINLSYKYARGDATRNIFLLKYVKLLLYYATMFVSGVGFLFTPALAGKVFFVLFLILVTGLMLRARRIFHKKQRAGNMVLDAKFVIYLSSLDIACIVGCVWGAIDRLRGGGKIYEHP